MGHLLIYSLTATIIAFATSTAACTMACLIVSVSAIFLLITLLYLKYSRPLAFTS